MKVNYQKVWFLGCVCGVWRSVCRERKREWLKREGREMQRGKWGGAFLSCCEDERDGREDLKKVEKTPWKWKWKFKVK